MTTITLKTIINAPIGICFDLSRSIDLHKLSSRKTKEEAVGGTMTGLIDENEFVTWEATHFMIKQRMTVKIMKMDSPNYFQDQMISGPFLSMKHNHLFREEGKETEMKDEFTYEVPYGFGGYIFDKLVLKRYMTSFLIERNQIIKEQAENGGWKKFIFDS